MFWKNGIVASLLNSAFILIKTRKPQRSWRNVKITSLAQLWACSVSLKKIKDQVFKCSTLKSCSVKCWWHKKGERTILQPFSKTKTEDLTIKKVILHCVTQSEVSSSFNHAIMDTLTPWGRQQSQSVAWTEQDKHQTLLSNDANANFTDDLGWSKKKNLWMCVEVNKYSTPVT